MVHVVGKDPSATKRVTHKACGNVLEYVENDVKPLYRGRDISGCSDGSDGFVCPACGKNVILRSW